MSLRPSSPRPSSRASTSSQHSSVIHGATTSSVHPPPPIPPEKVVASKESKSAASEFNKLLNKPKASRGSYRSRADIDDGLRRLRSLVLVEGIPGDYDPRLRPRVWKILLQVDSLNAASYLRYVKKGPCSVREKIRNDTFRTLATDQGFKARVSEDMLVRLLDAFVWKSTERGEEQRLQFTYVQGMNVLAAPFLYIMGTEIEAFYSFSKFIEQCCPLYVQPTLEGVHKGLKLLDRCLNIVDKQLYKHLKSKNLTAEIYAFPSFSPFVPVHHLSTKFFNSGIFFLLTVSI